MRLVIMFCLLPFIVYAQNYFEASGKTVAFTLKAGAKSGWNNTTAIEKTSVISLAKIFSIASTGSELFVHTELKGVLRVFNVRGCLAATITIEHSGFIRLSNSLPNGVYVGRFESPGITTSTARWAVVK